VGIEYRMHDWPALREAKISRPHGFTVIEEVEGVSAEEWKGGSEGKYAVLLMEKRGVDHFTAFRELSRIMKTRVMRLGIKDANAITKQLIYVNASDFFKVDLGAVNQELGGSIVLTHLGFADRKPKVTGNRFMVKISTPKTDELRERVRVLKEDPFLPAFIGYQRFGTRRPLTHLVGKALSNRAWCSALMLILGMPYSSETESTKAFRKAVMNGLYEEAIRGCPSYLKQERTLLKSYVKSRDCLVSLKRSLIPLSFYVEAYQSYLFNRYLSSLLKEGKVRPGSYVTLPTYYGDCDPPCKRIYEEEGIERGSFNIPEIKVKLRKVTREAFMRIRDLSLIGEDILTFGLDRGMYASLILREVVGGDPRRFT